MTCSTCSPCSADTEGMKHTIITSSYINDNQPHYRVWVIIAMPWQQFSLLYVGSPHCLYTLREDTFCLGIFISCNDTITGKMDSMPFIYRLITMCPTQMQHPLRFTVKCNLTSLWHNHMSSYMWFYVYSRGLPRLCNERCPYPSLIMQ